MKHAHEGRIFGESDALLKADDEPRSCNVGCHCCWVALSRMSWVPRKALEAVSVLKPGLIDTMWSLERNPSPWLRKRGADNSARGEVRLHDRISVDIQVGLMLVVVVRVVTRSRFHSTAQLCVFLCLLANGLCVCLWVCVGLCVCVCLGLCWCLGVCGGAPKCGAPKGGAPKGGAPKGGAPKGAGPKFSRFFFSSPAAKFVLFFPLWGSSRGILVGFLKRRGPDMCTFGVLGLSCEAPAAPKPPVGVKLNEHPRWNTTPSNCEVWGRGPTSLVESFPPVCP